MESHRPTHDFAKRQIPSWVCEWFSPEEAVINCPPDELEPMLRQLKERTEDPAILNTIDEVSYLARRHRGMWEEIGYQEPEDELKICRLFLRNELGRNVLIRGALQATFRRWVETLPFPIASILWRYNAEVDPRLKYDYLLKFFEALALFLTTVILSGLRSDESFFQEVKSKCFAGDPTQPRRGSLKQATFGVWTTVGRRLAKFTRSNLLDSGSRCLELYRMKDTDLLDSMVSEELYEILQRTLDYRNSWSHGGAVSEEEALHRLEILEWELAEVEGVLAGGSYTPVGFEFYSRFAASLLVTPRSSEHVGGVHDYVVDLLQGPDMIFRQIHVQSHDLMDKGRFYLLDPRIHRTLEILPFFRIMPSPKKDQKACYFYNRVENDHNLRWVSYHFADEPELVEPDEGISRLLDELEPRHV